ncbi:hypothetical protein NUACC21_61020 [Scytonema sp. NUACC21]
MGITINVVAGQNEATSRVSAYGSIQHIITDAEKKTFGIEDYGLKNAVEKYFGRKPNDAFLHSPTPWNDLYKTYGWEQVQTVLAVKSATITGITSQPSNVSTRTFTNNSSVEAIFKVDITEQVTNTVEHQWNVQHTITVGQEIEYQIGFLGTGGGGTTSFSYGLSWGQNETKSLSVTVGSSSGVEVTLQPGQSVRAALSASRGSMKVRIVYKASLLGVTAVNYDPPYRDHHFWALPINSVMSAAGLPLTKEFTEDIEIGYYSNGEIILTDPQGQVIKVVSLVDQAGIEPLVTPELVSK